MSAAHTVLQCLIRCSESHETTHGLKSVCSLESTIDVVPVNIGSDRTKGLQESIAWARCCSSSCWSSPNRQPSNAFLSTHVSMFFSEHHNHVSKQQCF